MPAAAARPPFDPRIHAPLVRRALHSFGVAPEALDDAVQDVFVVLVRRAADFDRERSVVNWLWGVARGVASTHRRTQARRARLHDALLERDAPPGIGADEAWACARATALITRFVDGLAADLREVFVRTELHGESGPELAAAMGINLNTAYARVRTVRLRFEAELGTREGVLGKLARMLAPLWLLAPKPIALAAIGLALLTVGSAWTPSRGSSALLHARSSAPIVQPSSSRERARPAKEAHMKTAVLTTAVLTTVLASTTAEARTPKPKRATAAASESDADAAARVDDGGQTTRYIFDGDDIDGEVLRPEGFQVSDRARARFPSMLTVRAHFLPDLVRMAKDV